MNAPKGWLCIPDAKGEDVLIQIHHIRVVTPTHPRSPAGESIVRFGSHDDDVVVSCWTVAQVRAAIFEATTIPKTLDYIDDGLTDLRRALEAR